mgnify:CR=1 FL=1
MTERDNLTHHLNLLKPGIAEVGDYFLVVGGFGSLLPTAVVDLRDSGFSYSGRFVAGNYQYGEGSGILVKAKDDAVKLYADQTFLQNLDHVEGLIEKMTTPDTLVKSRE